MNEWMDGWMDEWMNEWMMDDGWMVMNEKKKKKNQEPWMDGDSN